ncbi:MAG: hypothetical protein ACREUO_02165 [Burkholderiales bacterium]
MPSSGPSFPPYRRAFFLDDSRMLNADRQAHGLMISLRGILVHGVITVLAVAIAFSLPGAARYILFEWWPMVEADPNLLLGTEVILASVLVLGFNLAKVAWDNRYMVDMAHTAALVYTRKAARGWAARWRERRMLRRLPAARDAFVLTLTGYDTFIDGASLLRGALEGAYELRVMLVNPVGEALRQRADSLSPEITVLSLQTEIEATIAFLAELRRRGTKVTLKFYDRMPFWKVVVLGDHAWVQFCHPGFEVSEQPEYVFAMQDGNPRQGLFVPFYVHVLERWNENDHPEYDFDRKELVHRDAAGNETGRAPLGVPMNGSRALAASADA